MGSTIIILISGGWFHYIQRYLNFRGLEWRGSLFMGLELYTMMSSFQKVGIEELYYTDVFSFQGVGIERFYCIQNCPHFRSWDRGIPQYTFKLFFYHYLQIADFGLSRDLQNDNFYLAQGGKIPVKWTAPEALNYRLYSPASDIWSFGIVLYEIWSLGKKPYTHLDLNQVRFY